MVDSYPRLQSVEQQHEQFKTSSEEYVQDITRDVVRTYQEFGLAPEFAAILGRHMGDLVLTYDIATDASSLNVATNEDMTDWGREAVISRDELRAKTHLLKHDLHKIAPGSVSDDSISRLALDWILFELSADALGNSIYMQDKYDRYIKDFHGQARSFRSETTLARQFLENNSSSTGELSTNLLQQHHVNFKIGIGLVMLHDSLLREGIESVQLNKWIIQEIRERIIRTKNSEELSVSPLRTGELADWIASATPRKVKLDMVSLALSFVDEIEET